MTWGQERKECDAGVLRGWELGEKCTMHLIFVIHLTFKHFQKQDNKMSFETLGQRSKQKF